MELRSCERDAAVAELGAAAAIAAKRLAQVRNTTDATVKAQGSALHAQGSTLHAEQQAGLHEQRLAALQDQLEQASAQVLQLDLAVKHANSQQGSLKWQRDDLQRKLTVCEGEVRELESKLSAARMESAGEAAADDQ